MFFFDLRFVWLGISPKKKPKQYEFINIEFLIISEKERQITNYSPASTWFTRSHTLDSSSFYRFVKVMMKKK